MQYYSDARITYEVCFKTAVAVGIGESVGVTKVSYAYTPQRAMALADYTGATKGWVELPGERFFLAATLEDMKTKLEYHSLNTRVLDSRGEVRNTGRALRKGSHTASCGSSAQASDDRHTGQYISGYLRLERTECVLLAVACADPLKCVPIAHCGMPLYGGQRKKWTVTEARKRQSA